MKPPSVKARALFASAILLLLSACGSSPSRPSYRGGTGDGGTGGTGGRSQGGTGGGSGGADQLDAGDAPEDAAPPDDAAPPEDIAIEPPPPDAGPIPDAPMAVNEPPACARRMPVTSLEALTTAAAAAMPGDCIILANGSYTASAPISITAAGTAAARITITAETIGGATIAGTAGFHLDAPAAYVTIRGFKLTHAAPLVMAVGTSHCAITRNLFELTGTSGDYLWVQGLDQEIGYNKFQNKPYAGAMVQVDASGRSHAGTQRPYFHHNHWFHHTFGGGNGGECLATWGGFTRAEYNLFEDCSGDPEIVTAKSSDGIYRYNTFRNSTKGGFSMRYSNRTIVEGNFFFGLKYGVRLYGADHKIINNYFENNSGIGIYISDGTPTGTYLQIQRMLIAHNTLVNDGVLPRSGGLTPQTVTFNNNIIKRDTGTFVTEGPGWQVSYAGNIFWGAATTAIPAAGYKKVDPKLVASGGLSRLGAGSPAIDSATGPATVTDDMDGQPRSGTPDVGADEYSTAPVQRRPLTAADVGPSAGL
jgi:hypothetical protein